LESGRRYQKPSICFPDPVIPIPSSTPCHPSCQLSRPRSSSGTTNPIVTDGKD
jgi:hypothetical protein